MLSPLLVDESLELLVDWLVEFENDEDEEALEPNDLADSVPAVELLLFEDEFSSEFVMFDFELFVELVDWSELSFSEGGALFLQLSSVMARE